MTKRDESRYRPSLAQGSEKGASLVLTLAIMLVGSVLAASVAMYATVSNNTVKDFRAKRDERYAGEGAIEGAINWVRDNPSVATDPLLTNPDDCIYQMTTEVGVVTVNCGAPEGSGSGVSPSDGLTPPEAVLALGRRHNQPVPYNSADCEGWATPILDGLGWLAQGGDMNAEATKAEKWGEESIKIRERQGPGAVLGGLIPGPDCNKRVDRSGPNPSIDIQGKVVAAGRIRADYSNLQAVDAENSVLTTSDWIKQRDGVGSSNFGIPGVRPAGVDAAGTAEDSDPARKVKGGSNAPAVDPIGDIRSEWFPVGYTDSGANANVLTDHSGNPLPQRDHAYLLEPDSSVLTPALDGSTRACVGDRSQPIVFLPGWYRDSAVLNDYLANASSECSDRTFWFAPDAARSVDGQLKIVLDDDLLAPDRTVTGAYYFDFRQSGVGRACGDLPGEGSPGSQTFANSDSSRYRLCIGASATQSPRVVAGWPNEWSPTGSGGTVGEPGGTASIDVELGKPYVDKSKWSLIGQIGFDQLGQWQNLQGASEAGGAVATWEPQCLPLIGCLWFFGERSMTFKDFTPEAYASPIEQTGAENGRIYVNFRYALANGDRLPSTKLEVRAKALGVPDKLCAVVDLPVAGHEYNGSFAGGTMGDAFTYRTSDETAKEIADNCGQLDRINGLFVHFKVGGSTVNWSSARPTVYLDGVTADYKAFGGAAFPTPANPGGNTSDQVAAKSDCDPERPGAQFIFGGAAHVYVADGSLEICAGPYPTLPQEHQQIGVYQMPAVQPLRGTLGSTTGDYIKRAPVPGYPKEYGSEIGEPHQANGAPAATAARSYRFEWGEWTGRGNIFAARYRVHEARTPIVIQQYTPPDGYQIKRIEARVSYNPFARNNLLALVSNTSESSQLRTPRTKAANGAVSGEHVQVDALYESRLGVANSRQLVLYDSSSPSTAKLTQADLGGSASARTLEWAARRPCPYGTWTGLWEGFLGLFDGRDCPSHNELDGIELDITLEPTAANANKPLLLPASGCTIAYPNYGMGAGLPDCAVLRSNANIDGELPGTIWEPSGQHANWNGRFSVKGTVYTPSAAVEIDDVDFAYPAVTRGLIVRHLRISGWARRPHYAGPAILDGSAEPKAVPREAEFVACKQSETRQTAMTHCDADAGDKIISRASVNFAVEADENTASVPKVSWWSTEH